MKNTRFAWFLGIYTALMLCAPSFATDFALNPARDFGAIRRINPTDYNGYAVVRENGAGLSSGTAAAFRAALEVFSKAEAEPAGAVATHAGLTATHGATGAVVGTTNTQALTNKTLTDASNHISGSVIDSGTVADANIASTIARDSELASAMSAANASDALNLRLDGSRAMTGILKFSGNYGIFSNTSDGADNALNSISGGGDRTYDRGGHIKLFGNEYSGAGGQVGYYTGNVSTGDHVFYTGAGTERFRIAYNGRSGFGTSAPVNKLDLGAGTSGTGISWGGTNGENNYANIWTAYSNGDLVLATGMIGSTSGDIYSQSYTHTELARNAIRLSAFTANGICFFTDAGGPSAKGTTVTPSERMRITSGGNLLIGTTTDDGTNKLQVNGGITAAGNLTHANAVGVMGKETGGSARNMLYMSNANIVTVGNTSNATRINSNGTLTHNGNTVWTAASDGAGSGLDADTVPNATPASAAAAGTAGSIRYDANYIYICVAANTWKRAAISTW